MVTFSYIWIFLLLPLPLLFRKLAGPKGLKEKIQLFSFFEPLTLSALFNPNSKHFHKEEK
jgi:hypothetical protein